MTSPAPDLRPGDQLASTVCGAKVAVIRAPAGRRPLIACGGEPMVPAASVPPSSSPSPPSGAAGAAVAGTLIGKRYVDATETVELLCISSGTGVLSCDGDPMTIKAAKPLPASD